MGETKTKTDPPEFKIDAKLKQIKAELSKDDYNVVLAIVRTNINEKGRGSIRIFNRLVPKFAFPKPTTLSHLLIAYTGPARFLNY